MIAAMTSLGKATHQHSTDPLLEAGISQVFLAINPAALGDGPATRQIADDIVASVHNCRPIEEGAKLRYPGEQTLRIRAENRKLGLPVEPAVWAQIIAI